MNSVSGIAAASLALSSGARTQNAVASAPASAPAGATTVAPITWPAGLPVRGSTMWE
jgi:hypothetical protein